VQMSVEHDHQTEIPPMTDPLSVYWEQPNREGILVDDSVAVMSEKDFVRLKDYSWSMPSGAYVGKMWKAKTKAGKWFLCWYDEDREPGFLSTPLREILLCKDPDYFDNGRTLGWGNDLTADQKEAMTMGEVFTLLSEDGKPFSHVMKDAYGAIRERRIVILAETR
jgi:hypothetical protein